MHHNSDTIRTFSFLLVEQNQVKALAGHGRFILTVIKAIDGAKLLSF